MATMICDVQRRPNLTIRENDGVQINPQGLEYDWHHGVVTEESLDALRVKLDSPVRIRSFDALGGQCRLEEPMPGSLVEDDIYRLTQPIDIDHIQFIFIPGAPPMFLVKDNEIQ